LSTPDIGKSLSNETLALMGIFHKMHHDTEFSHQMVEYVLGNPNVLEAFGIVTKPNA